MECVGYIKIFNNKYFAYSVRQKYVISVHLNNIKIIEVNKYSKYKVK